MKSHGITRGKKQQQPPKLPSQQIQTILDLPEQKAQKNTEFLYLGGKGPKYREKN